MEELYQCNKRYVGKSKLDFSSVTEARRTTPFRWLLLPFWFRFPKDFAIWTYPLVSLGRFLCFPAFVLWPHTFLASSLPPSHSLFCHLSRFPFSWHCCRMQNIVTWYLRYPEYFQLCSTCSVSSFRNLNSFFKWCLINISPLCLNNSAFVGSFTAWPPGWKERGKAKHFSSPRCSLACTGLHMFNGGGNAYFTALSVALWVSSIWGREWGCTRAYYLLVIIILKNTQYAL